MTLDEATKQAFEKYPAYTIKRPDPLTGKPDCNITKMFKNGAREALIKKLIHAAR